MVQVKADKLLKDRLLGLNQYVTICDEAGNVIGRFFPEAQVDSLWDRPEPTKEELDEARKETGGRQLADILHDLERS
jgi:hypothetical protein